MFFEVSAFLKCSRLKGGIIFIFKMLVTLVRLLTVPEAKTSENVLGCCSIQELEDGKSRA